MHKLFVWTKEQSLFNTFLLLTRLLDLNTGLLTFYIEYILARIYKRKFWYFALKYRAHVYSDRYTRYIHSILIKVASLLIRQCSFFFFLTFPSNKILPIVMEPDFAYLMQWKHFIHTRVLDVSFNREIPLCQKSLCTVSSESLRYKLCGVGSSIATRNAWPL